MPSPSYPILFFIEVIYFSKNRTKDTIVPSLLLDDANKGKDERRCVYPLFFSHNRAITLVLLANFAARDALAGFQGRFAAVSL